MTVNVSLCGSIPRSQMNTSFCSSKNSQNLNRTSLFRLRDLPPSNSSRSCSSQSQTSAISSVKLCLPRQVSQESIVPQNAPAPPPIIEPPSWAVAARGDARLEPVCESFNIQSPVDLTKQAVFRIGRAQNSDVQLLHCTSSRRHAILFHHPNGSCYIVDCGSAHGTYVNGVRVKTVMQGTNDESASTSSSSGIILPHRVKKGALIRFGGPGAPSFILKSFSVRLDSLVNSLEETTKVNVCCNSNSLKDPSIARICLSSNTDRDHQSSSSSYQSNKGSLDALVTLNTRLNAIGNSSNSFPSKTGNQSLSLTSARLHAQLQPHRSQSSSAISFLKKRSVAVSFDDENDLEREIPCYKKVKMSTSAPSSGNSSGIKIESKDGMNIAIVSPSRQKPTLHFDFNSVERPVVSPTPIEDNEPLFDLGTHESQGVKSILTTPLSIPSSIRRKHRVIFSEKPPEVFYPPSVTPESSSDCEA